MARKILHLDLDAFFCAVEEQQQPALQGKPFAVGGRPAERGVVASCSYPARSHGVHSAMPMAQALRTCPGLLVVPTRHHLYSQVSRQVMGHLHTLTPLVEQVSIDEAFLDLTALPEPPGELAHHLQDLIRRELGLPCSLGVAANKLVAKIANDHGKASARSAAPPCAITVVPPGEEAAFLAPLPTKALWGVGPKTAARLAELGLLTIGDLARCPASDLVRHFGKNGAAISLHAQGIDDQPIVTEHEVKSISQETTFLRDLGDEAALRRTLAEQAASVGRQLRSEGLCCQTVKIKVRWPDFTTLTRQVSIAQPTDQDEDLFAAAWFLFQKVWRPGKRVRLLGLGAAALCPPARQLKLW